jgi:hypothetical protein
MNESGSASSGATSASGDCRDLAAEEFATWAEANRSKIEAFARANGAEDDELGAIVAEYFAIQWALAVNRRKTL